MGRMRTKIWIHNFQTRLMLRIALYLLFFQILTAFVLYSMGRMSAIIHITAPNSMLDTVPLMPILAGGFLAIAFLYDALKLTHRLVGPVVRFKQVMQSVADGEPVSRVKLRPGDMFFDVADTMNLMLDYLWHRGAVSFQNGSSAVNTSGPARSEPEVAVAERKA